MKRLLSFALCLVVVSAQALTIELIDSKPVANGAEVVLELIKDDRLDSYYQFSYRTKLGINWPFYRDLKSVKSDDEKMIYDSGGTLSRIGDVKFGDGRISLFMLNYYDYVLITLDIDESSPKVREDIFHSVLDDAGAKRAKLLKFDELELFDLFDSNQKSKTLTRNKKGMWFLEGEPYVKDLESTVSAVPLPPRVNVSGLIKKYGDSETAIREILGSATKTGLR